MNWSEKWISSSESISAKDSNWTSPFLKNVIRTFNDSITGPQNYENEYGMSIFSSLSSAEQALVVIPVLLILIINKVFSNRERIKEKNEFILSWPLFINPRTLFIVASYVFFSLFFPVMVITLVLSSINREIVKVILKKKYGNKFLRFMDGTDAIWALEEDNAKSVINVVTTVEVRNKNGTLSNGLILEKLKKTVKEKFFDGFCPFPKMFYKRSFDLGYFFWEENSKISIDDYVRVMNCSKSSEVSENDLNIFVSENCNSDMPYDNTASWEILVSDKPMKPKDNEKPNVQIYPLMFRIHHSLGDGVVLMKLLLRTIADEERKIKHQMSITDPPEELKSSLKQLFEVCDLWNIKQNLKKTFYSTFKILAILTMIPSSLMSQVMRPPDNNILHGPSLSGKKVCAWVSDNINDESLLVKIKRMKCKIPGATFSDLFLTALSSSYYNYFKQCSLLGRQIAPEYMTAVVPVRVEKSDLNLKEEISNNNLKLENRFSVAMLTVPISPVGAEEGKSVSLLKRLVEVRKQTAKLRHSADFYVNYCLMSIVGQLLPEALLREVLKSEQATMVVSNLPGPCRVTICGGCPVRDMAFFVPHRGTTGIGVTLLTCNGRVHLGLMADSALISCSEDAESILRGAVDELRTLDAFTSRRMCSQQDSMETHL